MIFCPKITLINSFILLVCTLHYLRLFNKRRIIYHHIAIAAIKSCALQCKSPRALFIFTSAKLHFAMYSLFSALFTTTKKWTLNFAIYTLPTPPQGISATLYTFKWTSCTLCFVKVNAFQGTGNSEWITVDFAHRSSDVFENYLMLTRYWPNAELSNADLHRSVHCTLYTVQYSVQCFR